MARIALDESMRPDQRKPVLMISHGLDRRGPALHVVASFALSSHLPAMNISVAVCTFVPHLREDGIRMALHASNALVHSAQGEVCLAVIEVGYVPDRLPTAERMAVLTRDLQRTVRTTSAAWNRSR